MSEWKAIGEYRGQYEVSDEGGVRSLYWDPPLIMRQNVSRYGYALVVLRKNGKMSTKKVHRLVAEAFIGACPSGYTVNHKDGNKLNNHVSNLEYMTRQENVEHARRELGLYRPTNRALSDEKVRMVKSLLAQGIQQLVIARKLNIAESVIWRIANGLTYRDVT